MSYRIGSYITLCKWLYFSHAIIYLSHALAQIFIRGLGKINLLFILAPAQDLVIFRKNFLFSYGKLGICPSFDCKMQGENIMKYGTLVNLLVLLKNRASSSMWQKGIPPLTLLPSSRCTVIRACLSIFNQSLGKFPSINMVGSHVSVHMIATLNIWNYLILCQTTGLSSPELSTWVGSRFQGLNFRSSRPLLQKLSVSELRRKYGPSF